MNGRTATGLLVLFIVLGTGLAIFPLAACSSSGSSTDPGDGDRSDSQETVQTFDAVITCNPLNNTLPATVKTCVNICNLVDSPRTVDGRIDIWLGGGTPLHEWRFRAVELAPWETWDNCWNNQLQNLQSLEDKNIARLRVVDVTPPPFNQPPYPPSGYVVEDTCFFWSVRS